MSTTLRQRLGGLVALMVLPLVTFAADERTCTMRDAALPSNSTTYVLCEEGLLLVTTNEGATWSQRKIPGVDGLRALAFADENRGLAIGLAGAIVATNDAGKTWQKREYPTSENLTDIQMIGDEGWIAGFDGVILHTADGGKTWTKQESGVTLSIETLFFLDAQNGWAAGWAGLVLHTTDGGKKWQVVKVPGATWSLSSIAFQNAKDGWISGFA
ncbi:MAG: glycosyl hydrolase, repeat-containing protein, partial [Candidatus Solibacter sp.]|nr:glycosyl hydrolase, repeat-containing protein [Candidatus Solibacter sp.]